MSVLGTTCKRPARGTQRRVPKASLLAQLAAELARRFPDAIAQHQADASCKRSALLRVLPAASRYAAPALS